MKLFNFLIFLFAFRTNVEINAVPLSILNNDLTLDNNNNVEDGVDDMALIDDDFTTHALEHLSSAATCLVAGVEYTHGQQIYRIDPCEFCLCLDGEMFCWWQDCPPTMEGPCKDRGPFTSCINAPLDDSSAPSLASITSTPTTKTAISKAGLSSTTTTTFTEFETNSSDNDNNSTDTYTSSEFDTSTDIQTTERPNHCLVMGREYQIGDKLPHNTGNCIECICGQGAKITCSPHQCEPYGDDINDYRLPGPRQQISDVF